jgi:predicted esterase
MSCYLLLATKLRELSPQGELPNQKTPFFLGHGHEDPVVRYEFGKMTHEHLKNMGFDVEFHSYRYGPSLSNFYVLHLVLFAKKS